MQEISVSKKGLLAAVAVLAGALVAFSMTFGVQSAWAAQLKAGTYQYGADAKTTLTLKSVTPGTTDVAVTKVTSSKKSITIPATVKIDGKDYKVTTVAKNAFKGAKKATKVTLPKTIKTIKANAFKGTKVKTLIVKSKLNKKSIKNAIKGAKKLKTIKVKIGSKKVNKKYVKKFQKYAGKKVKVKR